MEDRIKAFCVDFNWDELDRFASPGLYAQADPNQHFDWYRSLGVNTIQSFCVSHNGYAWYDSGVAPKTPGLKSNFLAELATMAHQAGMRIMGYWSPGGNSYWAYKHPDLSYPDIQNHWHIPFTRTYLEYVQAMLQDALTKIPLDGFMVDLLWNVEPFDWLPCEREMYEELMGQPFPGNAHGFKGKQDQVTEYRRLAVQRAWRTVYDTAKAIRPDILIWLSCNALWDASVRDSVIFQEVDWLMNEHPDGTALAAARRAAGPHTHLVQCVCGWGDRHEADHLFADPTFGDVGFYGFAQADPATTLPPDDGAGNARNIRAMRRFFTTA